MTREEFKELFDKYFDSIRSYLFYRCGDSDLATDIAQDVFMRVWEKQFELKGGRIKSLLYKIASEMFISHYRRVTVEQSYLGSIEIDIETETPEEIANANELEEKYRNALAALSDASRVVFMMNRNEDMTYVEIAERLGISKKAVEKRMKKALDHLRAALL